MKTVLTLAFGFLFFAVSASAQSFEEWKKQQMEDFNNFKSKQDKEFNAMLKQAWEFVNAKPAEKMISGPKIVDQPVAKPAEKPAEKKIIKVDSVVTPIVEVEKPNPVPPKPLVKVVSETPPPPPVSGEPKKEAPPKPEIKPLEFTFFGVPISLHADPDWKSIRLESKDPDGISKFFQKLSNSNYETMLNELYKQRKKYELNDWAFGRLVQTSVQNAVKADEHEIRMFTWFFLLKSGYNIKLGYNDNQIHLLAPTQQRLFGVSYYTLEDKKRYYLVDFINPIKENVSLYTYAGNYSEAVAVFDLRFSKRPELNATQTKRLLKFSYQDGNWDVPISYNNSLVELYDNYPQTDLTVYFQAALSDAAVGTLVTELKEIVKGKDEYTQVNMILRFVQTAFEYKTDNDQFGKEKYFFGEETLHFPFSDCEDRSILFASLVKSIVGLDVVGIKYPGHLATAVAFKTAQINGDQLKVGEKMYTICDPTYKNADIGMSMPKFKDQAITVVPF
jgi:hypothetical protein